MRGQQVVASDAIEAELWSYIERAKTEPVDPDLLQRVKNRTEASFLQAGYDLRFRFRLYLNRPIRVILTQAVYCHRNPATYRQMIDLDQNPGIKIQPMIGSSTNCHRILLESSQSRQGFAGVQYDNAVRGCPVYIRPRRSSDTRHVLHQIQHHPLSG